MEFPGLVQSNEQCYLAPAHGKILRHGSKINNLALQIQGPLSFRPEGEIFLLALLAGLASRKIPRSEDYARHDNGMSNL